MVNIFFFFFFFFSFVYTNLRNNLTTRISKRRNLIRRLYAHWSVIDADKSITFFFFSRRCVLSLRQRKETNSNCLASFRVQQGATSISIWLLGKARERERRKNEDDKDISSPGVFQVRYFYLSPSIVLKNKLLSSCIKILHQ